MFDKLFIFQSPATSSARSMGRRFQLICQLFHSIGRHLHHRRVKSVLSNQFSIFFFFFLFRGPQEFRFFFFVRTIKWIVVHDFLLLILISAPTFECSDAAKEKRLKNLKSLEILFLIYFLKLTEKIKRESNKSWNEKILQEIILNSAEELNKRGLFPSPTNTWCSNLRVSHQWEMVEKARCRREFKK